MAAVRGSVLPWHPGNPAILSETSADGLAMRQGVCDGGPGPGGGGQDDCNRSEKIVGRVSESFVVGRGVASVEPGGGRIVIAGVI